MLTDKQLALAVNDAQARATAGRDLAKYYDDAGSPVSAVVAREAMDAALDRLLALGVSR